MRVEGSCDSPDLDSIESDEDERFGTFDGVLVVACQTSVAHQPPQGLRVALGGVLGQVCKFDMQRRKVRRNAALSGFSGARWPESPDLLCRRTTTGS